MNQCYQLHSHYNVCHNEPTWNRFTLSIFLKECIFCIQQVYIFFHCWNSVYTYFTLIFEKFRETKDIYFNVLHIFWNTGFPHGKHVLSATVIELKSKKSPPFMKLLISTRYMFNCKQNLISEMHTSFEAYLPDILIARTEILSNSLYVLSSRDRFSASNPQFCKL